MNECIIKMGECINIQLHCNILCSLHSSSSNIKKENPYSNHGGTKQKNPMEYYSVDVA
jgi:hypothetical protein